MASPPVGLQRYCTVTGRQCTLFRSGLIASPEQNLRHVSVATVSSGLSASRPSSQPTSSYVRTTPTTPIVRRSWFVLTRSSNLHHVPGPEVRSSKGSASLSIISHPSSAFIGTAARHKVSSLHILHFLITELMCPTPINISRRHRVFTASRSRFTAASIVHTVRLTWERHSMSRRPTGPRHTSVNDTYKRVPDT